MKPVASKLNKVGDVSVAEILFYLAFFVYFIFSGIQRTEYLTVFGDSFEFTKIIIQIIVIGLLLLKLIVQSQRIEHYILAAAMVVLGFITWKMSGTAWLFWASIFIVSGYGVDIDRLSFIVLTSSLILLITTIGGVAVGVIPNACFVRGGVVRYGMGFIHPNYLGLFCFITCASFSATKLGSSIWPDLILLTVSAAFVLIACNSRTSVLLMVFQALLLIVFYFCKSERSRDFSRRLFLYLFIGIVVISLYFMVCYNPANLIHAKLNNVLSGRLYFMNAYFKLAPFSLFGCSFEGFPPIYWENGQSQIFVVDNAFAHLYLHFGVIAFAIFVAAYCFILRLFSKNKAWNSCLFLLVLMAVCGFTETVGLQIECNYALVILSVFLFGTPHMESGINDCINFEGGE